MKQALEQIRIDLDAQIKIEEKTNGLSPAWHSLCAAKDAVGMALLNNVCRVVEIDLPYSKVQKAWMRQKEATGANYWNGYTVGYDDAKADLERRNSGRY